MSEGNEVQCDNDITLFLKSVKQTENSVYPGATGGDGTLEWKISYYGAVGAGRRSNRLPSFVQEGAEPSPMVNEFEN